MADNQPILDVTSVSKPIGGEKKTMVRIAITQPGKEQKIHIEITPAAAEKLSNDLKIIS